MSEKSIGGQKQDNVFGRLELSANMTKEQAIQRLKNELFVRGISQENQKLSKNKQVKFPEQTSAFSESLPYGLFTKEMQKRLKNDWAMIDLEKLQGATVVDGDLSKLGLLLKNHLKTDTVFDLGSSGHQYVSDSVAALGGKRYVGIDKKLKNENAELRKSGETVTEVYFFEDDILSFVSKLKDDSGGIFYLSGIEPLGISDEEKIATQEYQDAVVRELWRVCKSGDIILKGPESYGFDFKKIGFKLEMEADGRIQQECTEVYIKP